jgi:ABC-type transport system substrate-binding protein
VPALIIFTIAAAKKYGNGHLGSQNQMQYIIENSNVAFSLHPTDVDRLQNSVLVKPLISTLLTTDHTHRRAPYLAEQWEQSGDKKVWSFRIRKGLTSEDGKQINAAAVVESFRLLLRLHIEKNPNVTAFSKVSGWSDFASGRSDFLEGLKATGDSTLEFHFDQPIDEGFLAYLSIPQFGFFALANFDTEGHWIGGNHFISSGAFSLKSIRNSDRKSVENGPSGQSAITRGWRI